MANTNNKTAIMFLQLAIMVILVSTIISTTESRMVQTGPDSTLQCDSVYGVKDGDTVSGIEAMFKLTSEFFDSINPNLNRESIFAGQWLCVAGKANANVITKADSMLQCDSAYGVKSGDTVTAIEATFKLTSESFDSLNPNLNRDSIFVGQWVCVAGKSNTHVITKVDSTLKCDSVYGVKNGDTVTGIETMFKLTSEFFDSVNPNLNRDLIFLGQWVCVAGKSN